jgi:hypothetical protein
MVTMSDGTSEPHDWLRALSRPMQFVTRRAILNVFSSNTNQGVSHPFQFFRRLSDHEQIIGARLC